MSEKQNIEHNEPLYPEEPSDLVRLSALQEQAKIQLGEDNALGSRGVEPEILRATFRLIETDHDKLDVHEDLGGGNPQKRRFENLSSNLLHNIEIIETDGAVYANGDRDIYQLVEGLKAVQAIFDYPGWDIKKSVNHAVNKYHEVGGENFKRNKSVIIYESLDVLQKAFKHTVKHPATNARNEELVEQFTEDICPSGLWGDAKLTEAMLESIDQAYEMTTNMLRSESESVESFVKKLQMELLKQGLGINKTKGMTLHARQENERKLANARILAWRDWQETGSEDLAD